MPRTVTAFEFGKIFTRATKMKLGKLMGEPSTYGIVAQLKSKNNRVVKIFTAPTLKKGRKEVAISINMGFKGLSPKVFKAGIVGFHGDNAVFYIIMDKIDGDYSMLKKNYPQLYVKYEKQIEDQISRLVTKLHSYDFIHGDLKDNNIGFKKMPSGPPKMYLLDFGFSLLAGTSLDTNKKFMKGFVQVYRELELKVNNIISQGYEEKIEKQFMRELKYNKEIKKVLKGPITINAILKELKKIQNKPYKPIYANVKQNGPLRLSMGNRHWVIYDPLNANTLHGKSSNSNSKNKVLSRLGNKRNDSMKSDGFKKLVMKKSRK